MKGARRTSILLAPLVAIALCAAAFGPVDAAAPAEGRGFAAACPGGGGAAQSGPPGAACLGCHDGAIAPNVDVPDRGAVAGDPHRPHPVGMRYSDAAARDPMGFAPEWEVRRILDLPSGHMECGSCHLDRPDVSKSRRLAHQGDRLCTTCHRK